MNHSKIIITDVPATKYLGVTEHVESGPKAIGEFYTRVFAKLGQFVGMKGISMAGMPFGIYTNYTPEGGEITGCFPIQEESEGDGDIVFGELTPSPCLHTIHTGSYDLLHQTWTAIEQYGKSNGIKLSHNAVEMYLDDPGAVPEADVRTAIYWPIAK